MSRRTASTAAALVAISALAALPSPAQAQTDLLSPFAAGDPLWRQEDSKMECSVSLSGHAAWMSGKIDTFVDVDYGDLYGSGFGFTVEGDVLWKAKPGLLLGAYLSISYDNFSGKSFTDDFGDTLAADDFSMLTFLVGFKTRYTFGKGWFLDGRIGFGAVDYSKATGTLTLSGVPLDVGIFKAGAKFAFETAVTVGYDFGRLFVDFGLGVRLQGAPGEADLSFTGNEGPAIFGLELGIGVRF